MATPVDPATAAPAPAPAYQPPADLQQRATLVHDSLARAERHLLRVQRYEVRALVVSLLASGLTTVLAGVPAIANRAPGGWRLTCALTAALAATGTIVTAVRQHLAGAERVAKAEACVGRLRALSYGARVGVLRATEIDAAYQDILKEYPAIL